mgnify:CR=1 FL=1
MDRNLADFLTRLIAIRTQPDRAHETALAAIDAYYELLDQIGIEHCYFGGFEIGEDGTPSMTQFSGTRLTPAFIEEFTHELAIDDYVLRRGQTLDAAAPILKFETGMPALDEIEAFHAPARKVQVECARQGVVEGVAMVGNTALAASPTASGHGRFFGFVFGGKAGTRSLLKKHGDVVEIASFALLDQIKPQIEATIDGYEEPLSGRQLEVLAAVANGAIRKQIAFDFNIALPTVDMHLSAIRRKLHAATLSEAVAKAYRYAVL